MEQITAEKLSELKKEGKKLLVDYYGTWCGPCRTLIPTLEKLESEYSHVTFVKVNVDQSREHIIEMDIKSIPTVMIYNGETLVNRSTGLNREDYYKNILNGL